MAFIRVLLLALLSLTHGQSTQPANGCPPCRDVIEGPLSGTYVLDPSQSSLCGDGCTYVNSIGSLYCFQLNGLYDTVNCGGEVGQAFTVWTSTGTVPDKLGKVPDEPLTLKFGNLNVEAGKRYDTSEIKGQPSVSWPSVDKNSLYTLLIEDNDIDNVPPIKFSHYLATNIPGNDLSAGTVVNDWFPSFYFKEFASNQTLDTSLEGSNRHLAIVYKQPGAINVNTTQIGCTPEIISNRIVDHDRLQADYNLEGPVAGTFFRVGYSPFGATDEALCRIRKCAGFPLPFEIQGVNTSPECLP